MSNSKRVFTDSQAMKLLDENQKLKAENEELKADSERIYEALYDKKICHECFSSKYTIQAEGTIYCEECDHKKEVSE